MLPLSDEGEQVGILILDSASLFSGRNSDSSGEISLSYKDSNDGLLYYCIFHVCSVDSYDLHVS